MSHHVASSCSSDAEAVISRITVSAAWAPAPVPPAPSATAITTPSANSITLTRSSHRCWYATVIDVVSKPCMLTLGSCDNLNRWICYFVFATSQSLITLSALPETSILPSALYARDTTLPVCPLSVASSLSFATSQSLIVPSLLPAATVLPSGLNATHSTAPPCPFRLTRSLPVTTSHSLRLLSRFAVARVLPSGLKAAQ